MMVTLRPTCCSDDRIAPLCPDFLIISPPKTGSTWLANNLRCHPQVFIPDIKEVKYFSSFFRWFDLDWYLDYFRPASGRLKGEASPSYAILPVERIHQVRRLTPNMKLIYLMREPMARAWSHAKHNRRYREANFASCPPESGPVSDEQWCANFTHDWPLVSGDYLGQLRRWLSVFPPEQVYVGYYESIASEPATLLRQLFRFLGVDPDVDLSAFPLFERILPGSNEELSPSLARCLHRLLHDRTVELASFLDTHFGLSTPVEWQTILAPARDQGDHEESPFSHPLPAFRQEFDGVYLSSVVAQEAAFPGAYRPVDDDYLGYRIVFYRGELLALAPSLGPTLPSADPAERKQLQDQGVCFTAPTLAELKDRVARHVFDRTRVTIRTLETDLGDARSRIAHLEGRMDELGDALGQVQRKAFGLTPREFALLEASRKLARGAFRFWRRLTAGSHLPSCQAEQGKG